MSIIARSAPSTPTRKRAAQAIGSPLKIQIPQWTPTAAVPELTPALATSPESESDGTANSPSTPRNSVVSPQRSATIVTVSSSLDAAAIDDVDYLKLGSLSLEEAAIASKPHVVSASPSALGPIIFLKALAKGSCGCPFVAFDKTTSTTICAKVFQKKAARTSPRKELLRTMLAELRAYKRISEAEDGAKLWLMEIHGVVQDTKRVLFAMDLMHADLFTILDDAQVHTSRGVPTEISKLWIAQLALGIDALHNMGIIHRDLKPENVLVSLGPDLELKNSHVRITDFGNAWQAPGDSIETHMQWLPAKRQPRIPLDWQSTYSRTWIGTPEYMAPEIHRREAYGPMVDWWALGHLAYDIFTGQSLFPDERALQYFLKWQANPPDRRPYIEYRGPSWLSTDQMDLVTKLLAVKPTDRFRLPQLEAHPYFALSKTTIFDQLRRSGAKLVRLAPKNDTPSFSVHSTAHHVPALHIRVKLPEARCTVNADPADLMFEQLSWVNPRGLWGTLHDTLDADIVAQKVGRCTDHKT